MPVPENRIRALNTIEVSSGEFVLYWMVAFRRLQWNFALERAVEHATRLGLPLLVFEPLRAGYEWASARHHRFVLDGMADQRDACEALPVGYYPYVEPEKGQGAGLLEALADKAAVIVSDDFPAFFIPRMHAAAAAKLRTRLEVVDSNGMLPMISTDRVFTTAHSFRAHLQKNLKPFLQELPREDPIRGAKLKRFSGLPKGIAKRWPVASDGLLDRESGALDELPIDHSVASVGGTPGGARVGRRLVDEFIGAVIARYTDQRNEPEKRATSQLSAHLHFGHVSSHQIFDALRRRESSWSVRDLPEKGGGSREGWWKMSPEAESFLDELITWRELGFNMASKRGADYEQYSSLPEWARKTLDDHRDDERPYTYTLRQFDNAETDDELWNAAQRQLVRDGRIHNYLRMLWGKKILEWTETPEDARDIMVELNNRYALDGRDPNSYSGIMWVLGRYDRAWGPERPIYGKVRYMSSKNTAKKIKVKGYLERYSA